MAAEDIQVTLSDLESVWSELAPGVPFNFQFLDETIDRQYRSEQSFRTVFSLMTGLSLMIACLGLLGLAAFTAEQRTKEIGIRKVVGASVSNIIALLSKETVMLVLLSNVVAWPIAYVTMNKWLVNFAYRIDIGFWTFALAGFSALIIAAITVSFQAFKAAMANPVDSLSYE